MTRGWLAGLVVCGLLGAACGQRPRETAAAATPSATNTVPVPARIAAIGDAATLPPELQRALDPTGFEPLPLPGPDDWLAHHAETPQPFISFVRAERNTPTRRRGVIYLLPIGGFPATAPPLAQFAALVHVFFGLEVRTLPAVRIRDVGATTRINQFTNRPQLLSPEVLAWLKTRLPNDAFGLLAVTMEDLYPDATWNFVFGQASLKDRVGVQSLARQDPAFFGDPRPRDWQTLARRRAAWTLLHEISHMFGLTHCTYWRCVVAGANSQEEADRSPLHVCPVCLRKLQWAIRFDPAARERALADEFSRLGIADEAGWSAARAAWIRDGMRIRGK